MKKIFNTIINNIFKYNLIFIIINVVVNLILYIFNIRFQTWVINLTIIIIIIGFIVGLFNTIYKHLENKKITLFISFITFTLLIMLFIILMPITKLIIVFSYKPEHIVKLDNKKYVAVVESFLHVNVYYYDYYGPFLMGTKIKVHGYFGRGGYDPFDSPNTPNSVEYTYYNSKGEIINKKNTNIINDNEKYLLPEEEKILYEIKFNNTILRFTLIDYALGQNMLVHVIRSKDSGESFYDISEEIIQVSNEAKFKFINENLGFVINTGKIFLNKNKPGIYITTDGGVSFNSANFEYENENIEYIEIKGFPYYENNKLKIKCSVYEPREETNKNKELTFISKDKGLNWKLE